MHPTQNKIIHLKYYEFLFSFISCNSVIQFGGENFADGVPVLKWQSIGPENHCNCISSYCSDVTNGSACRTWRPNPRWV